MKRFRVHVSVQDLTQSFAISTRDRAIGVNHAGLQVDSAEELAEIEAQLKRASSTLVHESNITCCYAVSDKYWVTDPQGVAWEVFHTRQNAPIYGEYKPIASYLSNEATACCNPLANTLPATGDGV